MEKIKKIAIIGGGEIGQATVKLLADKVSTIAVWDIDESHRQQASSLAEALAGSQFVFLALPSEAVRDVVAEILPHLEDSATIVCLAKGLENESGLSMDLLLNQILPTEINFVLISGPMIAEEILANRPGAAMVAGSENKAVKDLLALFANTNLRLLPTNDLRGVALAGPLKNIYAFGLGLGDGLDWGENLKGLFLVSAIAEMERIVSVLGGQEETMHGLAGLGDLVVTGFSLNSRNRSVGEASAKAGRPEGSCEGLSSAKPMAVLLGEAVSDLPLFEAIYKISTGEESPAEALSFLTDRLA